MCALYQNIYNANKGAWKQLPFGKVLFSERNAFGLSYVAASVCFFSFVIVVDGVLIDNFTAFRYFV